MVKFCKTIDDKYYSISEEQFRQLLQRLAPEPDPENEFDPELPGPSEFNPDAPKFDIDVPEYVDFIPGKHSSRRTQFDPELPGPSEFNPDAPEFDIDVPEYDDFIPSVHSSLKKPFVYSSSQNRRQY